MDIPALNANAANIYPGHDQENTNDLCHDGVGNDCDFDNDCADSDCTSFCQPSPTPTPGGDDPPPSPDPCDGDECCGLGTHTECSGGDCEPEVTVCWNNPYTGEQECHTYPADCEPETCVEVCN